MENFVRYRHCVGETGLHIQLTPKYRKDVFVDETIREGCRRILYEIGRRIGIDIQSIEFGPNHVHLFITNWRKYSISQLVQYLKGASSREIRRTMWERVRKYEWGKAFWHGGYFFETVGRITSESIKFYIERMQRKHWKRPVEQAKLDAFAN